MKKLIALMALVSASTLGLQAPAHAAGSAEQIALCAEALRTGGLAPEDAFKTEFKGIKGASLRTVTMKLIPLAGGAEQLAECQIKRGKVVAAEIKA